MMVRGITREGRELRSGKERVEYKKDRGIDRDRGVKVLIFPA